MSLSQYQEKESKCLKIQFQQIPILTLQSERKHSYWFLTYTTGSKELAVFVQGPSLSLPFIIMLSFALLAFDWLLIEWTHPDIFCSGWIFPLENFRAVKNCNQIIRWYVGEVWIGYDTVQMFSWVLGTQCDSVARAMVWTHCFNYWWAGNCLQWYCSWQPLHQMQEKLWELNCGMLPFHGGYSIWRTHICYNFTKPEWYLLGIRSFI